MTIDSELKDKVTLDLVDRIHLKLRLKKPLTNPEKRDLCENLGEQSYKRMYHCSRETKVCPKDGKSCLEYQGKKYCNIYLLLAHYEEKC